jgi:VWFA-related protein
VRLAPVAALALAVLACAMGTLAGAQAPPTFRASVEAVRVDALVLDGDTPVAGLTARNFELTDTGVPQTIDAISYEDEPLRVMLALDTSYSVHGEPLGHLRDAANAVVEMLAPRDRAAVVTFATEIDLACPWTSDHAMLTRALDRTTGAGATSLHDAAYSALVTRDEEPGRSLILLFSDGDDTASWLPGDTVLDVARRTDTVVYTVGSAQVGAPVVAGFRLDVSSGIQRPPKNDTPRELLEKFLPELAHETGGKHVDAKKTDKLRDVFTRILREFRTRYALTYTPQGVEKGGWHPIEVTLKGAKGKVTARRGYLR